jgi:hypothetical protein
VAADVLEAHLFECLLPLPQLVLVHIEAYTALPECLPLALEVLPQDPQVVPNPLLIRLEEADLLRVGLVPLRLPLQFEGLSLKHLPVDPRTLRLLVDPLVL